MNKYLWVALLAFSCSKPVSTSDLTDPIPYFSQPANFPNPVYLIKKNPITPEGFELGKKLFYDGILSRDSTIACGECHRQSFAFSHHMHELSHGIENRFGLRNSQPLQNLAWQKYFLWDGRVNDIEKQGSVPITHPDEMDDTMENVVKKLKRTKGYPPLFKATYGTDEITEERTLVALTQFMLSLVSANSKYDQVLHNKNLSFTPEEQEGMRLFESKGCKTCHAGELFTDGSFRNNGLPKFERTKIEYINGQPILKQVVDEGRYRVTQLDSDRFKFKVPSLRNVAVSLPYTHDGRFATLLEVLDHYATGVKDTPNLDPLLKQNGKLGIPLTLDEKRKIISFLYTLTDQEFLNDKRFAEPNGFPVR